jgi:hypothetical protein
MSGKECDWMGRASRKNSWELEFRKFAIASTFSGLEYLVRFCGRVRPALAARRR